MISTWPAEYCELETGPVMAGFSENEKLDRCSLNSLARLSQYDFGKKLLAAARYWETYWAVQKQVKTNIEAAGLTIPFPQRDLNINYKD